MHLFEHISTQVDLMTIKKKVAVLEKITSHLDNTTKELRSRVDLLT